MSEHTSRLAVRLLAGVLTLLGILASIEITVAVAARIKPNLFGQGDELLEAIEKIDDKTFRSFAERAIENPSVWDNYPGSSTSRDCVGRQVVATFDRSGSRVFPGYDGKAATVVLIGDSFTAGAEANDDETIAAHLYRGFGIVAANLGVGGYSPLQAVLKLEARAREFPSARTVVLGVMFENIRRNVNSNNAILSGIVSALGVRPYVREGQIKLVPKETFDSLEGFKAYAKKELEADYWYTPSARFPFSLALIRLVTSRSFVLQNESRVMKSFGRQYAYDYRNAELTRALGLVLDKFAEVSKAANLKPYVIFIPYNSYDRDSPAEWVANYRSAQRNDLDVSMLDVAGIDWSRYHLGHVDQYCHPSSYGYETIARGYAKELRKELPEGTGQTGQIQRTQRPLQ